MRVPIDFRYFFDMTFVLDGQIGNTLSGIQSVRAVKRIGRTNIETLPTTAAVIWQKASSGSISSVVYISPKKSQEPNCRETRLVCLPCQPTPAVCAMAFRELRGSIDKNLHITVEGFANPAADRFEAFLHEIVVIVIPCIDGNIALACFSRAVSSRSSGS